MGDTTILAELYTMHNKLSSKTFLIIHGEVPIEIIVNTQRKHTIDLDSGTEQTFKNKGKKLTGDFQPKHMAPTSQGKYHVTH